jgi:hypothetical protein
MLLFIPGAQPLVDVSVTLQPTLAVGEAHVGPGKLPNNTVFGAPRNFDIFPDGKAFHRSSSSERAGLTHWTTRAAGGSGGELAGGVPRALTAHHQLRANDGQAISGANERFCRPDREFERDCRHGKKPP